MRVSLQVVRRSLPYLAPHIADRASIGQRPLDGHSGNDQEQSRDESRRPCVSYRRRQPVTGILLPKLSIQTGHQRRIEGDFRQQYRSRVHDIQNGNQAAQCTNAGDHNHPQISDVELEVEVGVESLGRVPATGGSAASASAAAKQRILR